MFISFGLRIAEGGEKSFKLLLRRFKLLESSAEMGRATSAQLTVVRCVYVGHSAYD